MLLRNLEEGSATVSAVRGNRMLQGWTIEALLLRIIANHAQIASWQRGGGKRSSQPKEIELPEPEKPKRVARVADIKKRLAQVDAPSTDVVD